MSERIGGRHRTWRYMRCPECGLIQSTEADLPAPAEERERYQEHNNSLDDPRYRRYLTTFIERALSPFLQPGAPAPHENGAGGVAPGSAPAVLDYGSGPEPALVELLRERGYDATGYDPFFTAETDALTHIERYDAITAVEVVEHFHNPGKELGRIDSLLKREGGLFAVRTGLFAGTGDEFTRWWYRNDHTHVSFWTEETVAWVSRRYNYTVVGRAPGDIVTFRKVAPPTAP